MVTEILAPTRCPDCNSPIEEFTEARSKIVTHWCNNESCAGRIKDMLTFIADRHLLEIEGLGPEMADKLAKEGFVVDLADLFEFQVEAMGHIERVGGDKFEQGMLKQGFSGAAALKMVNTLERAKTAPWDRWLAALGIPMIGVRLGKVLAEALNLHVMANLPDHLLMLEGKAIEGIGVHKKTELLKYAKDGNFQELCHRLHQAGVAPKALTKVVVEGTPLAGMSFVITGEFPTIGSREYITAMLVSLGAVSKSGVTKKVTHLLVGDEPGRTKLSKAAELKIPHLDQTWLDDTFDKYEFKKVGSSFTAEDAL